MSDLFLVFYGYTSQVLEKLRQGTVLRRNDTIIHILLVLKDVAVHFSRFSVWTERQVGVSRETNCTPGTSAFFLCSE